MATVWILFLIAVSFPYLGIMEIGLFPKIDMDYFSVNIKLPIGQSLEETKIVTEQIEEIVSNIPELDNFVTTISFFR